MDLVTSVTMLKAAMNGGIMPPMTPITDAGALAIINPEYTIGLGALREDPEKGLQCPSCGEWRHKMSTHMVRMHGKHFPDAVLDALEIPRTTKLISSTLREKLSQSFVPRGGAWGKSSGFRKNHAHMPRGPRRGLVRMAGWRNLRNRCDAQMAEQLTRLQVSIGRSPSANDAKVALGHSFVCNVQRVYGTWNAAKARFGLEQYSCGGAGSAARGRESSRDAVIAALAAYHEVNGCLPSLRQANSPTRAPLIPHVRTIMRAFSTTSWPEAMRCAAALLDIHGGRYGLPVRDEAA